MTPYDPFKQSKTKPKIEEVIPEYLTGDNKQRALDFVAWLRANKMSPAWKITNGWSNSSRGILYYIRLPLYDSHFRNLKQSDGIAWEKSWVLTPYLHHIEQYEELIIKENLQDFILSGLHYCTPCPHRFCATEKTVFGNTIKNLCKGDLYGGLALWYVNPSETELIQLKRLLKLEKQARSEGFN